MSPQGRSSSSRSRSARAARSLRRTTCHEPRVHDPATSAFFFTSEEIVRHRLSSTVVFLDPCQPLPYPPILFPGFPKSSGLLQNNSPLISAKTPVFTGGGAQWRQARAPQRPGRHVCANLLNDRLVGVRLPTARPEETRRPSANRSSAWIGSFDGSPTVGLSSQAAL